MTLDQFEIWAAQIHILTTMQAGKAAIQIRLAEEDDATSIASVLRASFAQYEASYTPEAFAATTPTSEQIQIRLREGPIWVASRDGLIVGTGSVVSRGESLYIRGMAVLPEMRGQAIGEILLKHVENFAVTHSYRRLILSTTPFLRRAILRYEKFGFVRCNEGPDELHGTPLFTMEKLLA